jgi:hypothetical protein
MKTLALVQMVLGSMVVAACSIFLINVNDYPPGTPIPECASYNFTIFVALLLGISVSGVGLVQSL